ncbi:MAG: cyclic nucleotide-binding domain-containing protein [Pseudomonadota bacterium]
MAKIRSLRRCALFKSLGYRDLAILAQHVEEGTAPAEKWLLEEGTPSDGMFILKSGRVSVSMKGRGDETVEMGPGEFLGELSVLPGAQVRAVGAKCLERCEYLRLATAEWEQLKIKAPDVAGKVAQGILESVAEKMSATQTYLRDLMTDPRKGAS